ncbi:phage baseplate upper protein [Melissococcus plutonius]|uniref:phage baseplate upper protein n=2 Tax=Melissococcus plutonius TaxID=33970 RepID=UPI0021E54515|nr:phage baseplate upper protein [Melissococcus plutonius]MCV2505645.1 phage baseplate upper protein [Melissococcus plutonius]
MTKYDLYFDLANNQDEQISQQLIAGRVGDNGLRTVIVKVDYNKTSYNLTGLSVFFEGLTSDGRHIIDKQNGLVLDPQNGVFRYSFPEEAFAVPGDYKQAFFKIMLGDKAISTMEFAIHIRENLVELGINSKDYLSEYDQLIKQLKQKFDLTKEEIETVEMEFKEWFMKSQKQFTDWMAVNEKDYKTWFQSIKDILESVDPNGKLLSEIIDARQSVNGSRYASLKERLDTIEELNFAINDGEVETFMVLQDDCFSKNHDYEIVGEVPTLTIAAALVIAEIDNEQQNTFYLEKVGEINV